MEKHPLFEKQPELQRSEEVSRAVERKKHRTGEKTPNIPGKRLEVYLDRLENIFLNEDEQTRERNIQLIRPKLYKKFIIDRDNVPESYFDLQKKVAREQGYGDIEISQEQKDQMIDTIIEDQTHSLDQIVDYFTSDDAMYPTWFKYFAFDQLTRLSQFDKERGVYKKRTDSTTAPFPDLDREALALMSDFYESVINDREKLKDPEVQKKFTRSFPKVYAQIQEDILQARVENREEIQGEWVKYEQGTAGEAERLYESLQNKGTGWCTAGKSTAEQQIQSGDFYVYYTNNDQGNPTQPRLAIRMNGSNEIAEVRGILPHQNVEPLLQDTLDEKLDTFGDAAQTYKQKSQDMKYLTDIDNRFQNDEDLTDEDLRFLYELDRPIQSFGYDKDPRIENILEQRDVKEDLPRLFNTTPDKISATKQEALSGDIVYHYGDLNLSNLTSAEGLTLPDHIGGRLALNNLTSAEGLTLPDHIGGRLVLSSLTSAEGLNLPQSIGGDLNLYRLTSAKHITFPNHIGEDLDLFNLTTADGLTLPDHIGGRLDLNNLTTAKGLTLPDHIGEDLSLNNLTTAEGLTLPDHIGGDLFLSSLTTAEGLTLPDHIGGDLDLYSLTTAEGLTLPDHIGGDLFLSSLITAEGLNLPQSIGGDLDLNSLTTAEGLNLPQSIGGDLDLKNLPESEKQKLREKFPHLAYKIQ